MPLQLAAAVEVNAASQAESGALKPEPSKAIFWPETASRAPTVKEAVLPWFPNVTPLLL
jgi:hypothetical protein